MGTVHTFVFHIFCMTDSLGTLLKASFEMYKTKFVPIGIGAVIFGVLTYGAQLYFQQAAISSMQGNPYANLDRLEQLADRAERGDQAALQELMEQAGMMENGTLSSEDLMNKMAMDMMRGVLPTFSVFLLLTVIISVIAGAYYLVLSTDPLATAQTAAAKTPQLFLPLLGVWVWSFVRSFVWVPIIGVIIAIVLGPKLMLAPVILVRENASVFDSVKLSLERSRGYWGKIVGNVLVLGLILWVAMLAVGVPLSLMADTSTAILAVSLIVGYIVSAYSMMFIVKLADTIIANPKQV